MFMNHVKEKVAESFNFSVKKMIDDEKLKEFITEDDKKKLLEKLEKHEGAIKNRNIQDIESIQKEIEEIWNPIVTKMYQSQQQASNTGSNPFANMGGDNPFANMNFADGMNNMYDSQKNSKKDNGPEEVPFEEVK